MNWALSSLYSYVVLHQDIRTSFPRTENVKRKAQASSPDQTDSVSKVHKADNDVH